MKILESKLIGHKDTLLSIATHKSKEILGSSSDDKTVRIWDSKTNKPIQCINAFSNSSPVNNLIFDNDYYLYCSHDNIISVFDLRQPGLIIKNESFQYKLNKEEINQLNFDSKFQYIASCDDSGQVMIIDTATKKLYETLDKKHTNICSSVVFRYGSKNELLTGSMDCTLLHWNFMKARTLHRENYKSNEILEKQQKIKQQQQQQQLLNPPFVNSIDISNDGKYVSCGMGDGNVQCLEISSFKLVSNLENSHSSSVSIVHYPQFLKPNNCERLISVGNYDRYIKMWDLSPEMNSFYENPLNIKRNEVGELDQSTRIKLVTQHHSKINCLTTSNFNNNIYIADISNDLTILTILDD